MAICLARRGTGPPRQPDQLDISSRSLHQMGFRLGHARPGLLDTKGERPLVEVL